MDNEDPNELFEELHQKHRKEKRELQGKIQALKKSASKGDKKRKKEVLEEISKLEAETTQKQEEELLSFKVKNNLKLEELTDDANLQSDLENGLSANTANQQRMSKAQKRRVKKITQLKERELRILEQDVKNLDGARHTEMEEIKRILKERGLMIQEITSDGNCLYNAVLHRLKELDGTCFSLLELRSEIGIFLRDNRMEYLPYLSHPDTGNMLTDNQYDEYCDQVANTTAWGGEVELRAISHVLKRPIEVIQAKGPTVLAGEEYKKTEAPLIVLTYHRHMYGLGEHYNSVTEYKEEKDEFSV